MGGRFVLVAKAWQKQGNLSSAWLQVTENDLEDMPAVNGKSHLRLFSNWLIPRAAADQQMSASGPLSSQAEGAGIFRQFPWQCQQVRTKKRGTEYQPKNLKRKRTHGWIKRLSTQGGIEVILRRMLKGRKSLSH
ncbi:large ribosomal subunit protein bL34m isoform X2 [Hippocampus comes]|uniref:large ribosomal subunit protein bL34m isoform X2 n=1 Tax=Hippocampus comes TaxID=109280 RepID=UPI00094F0B78|nr:PREDICTED: 39S ribosomal protein L34, mitochondrial isoform X2 [Hippocampus comes]